MARSTPVLGHHFGLGYRRNILNATLLLCICMTLKMRNQTIELGPKLKVPGLPPTTPIVSCLVEGGQLCQST